MLSLVAAAWREFIAWNQKKSVRANQVKAAAGRHTDASNLAAIKNDGARAQELSSRVFAKSCRNCLKEAIYNLDQITDFQLKDSV